MKKYAPSVTKLFFWPPISSSFPTSTTFGMIQAHNDEENRGTFGATPTTKKADVDVLLGGAMDGSPRRRISAKIFQGIFRKCKFMMIHESFLTSSMVCRYNQYNTVGPFYRKTTIKNLFIIFLSLFYSTCFLEITRLYYDGILSMDISDFLSCLFLYRHHSGSRSRVRR